MLLCCWYCFYLAFAAVAGCCCCCCRCTCTCTCSGCGCGCLIVSLLLFFSPSQSTFNYSSPFWTNTATYMEENGEDLNEKETKLATFGGHQTEKGYCLGMKVNGKTNWMVVHWKSGFLYARFLSDSKTPASSKDQWRSLVNNSSMQVVSERVSE